MAFDIQELDDVPYYYPYYDYRSAVSDAVSSGYFQLYSLGCQVGGSSNCTAACLDTSIGANLVWNGTYDKYNTLTMANCMALPFIASLLAAGNLSEHAVNLTQKYHIPSNANLVTNASAGWPVINNCIDSYCDSQDSTPGCSKSDDDLTQFVFLPNETYYDETYYDSGPSVNITFRLAGKTFNAGLCHELDAVINPDIGGIGMFVSYLMQEFIVLSAWLAYHFYQTWAAWPLAAVLMPFHGPKRASLRADQLQRAIRASHHTAALVSALVEFQKAQVFFMLAVQIAALIALHNPSYVQATSWQQLWNNLGILYNLAFGGCLPVLFSLFILRLAGKRSVYTLAVSFCCVAISAATWFLTWSAEPNPNTTISYTGPNLPACGGMTAPIKYCYDYGWFVINSDATSKGIPMLVFCFVVQLCLILDLVTLFQPDGASGTSDRVNCFQWLRSKTLRANFWGTYEHAVAHRLPWLAKIGLDTAERVLARMQSFILLATELVFVGLNAVLITDYAHILLPNDFQSLSLNNWALGQVISSVRKKDLSIAFMSPTKLYAAIRTTTMTRYLSTTAMG
ncbi:hypothetical protein LTR36_008360 [Oleoguttula mirabilis]|uniref:Uncharacterized protein n=1 Tax=Oleoguttula mirabilis TaxID=1507867 RepID=A0AAV9J7I0_9PEZI|nr:hypothetical protein LTR36_008360 [Oleoguttula mirabilis]